MLFVSKKYESLDTIFEYEMNEGRSTYSSNKEINDFIMKRTLPNIKDHLESAYDNSGYGFTNAENPWFLIFDNPSDNKKKGALMFSTKNISLTRAPSDYNKESKETVEKLFGDGYTVEENINGGMRYFTVTDQKDNETIAFKYKGTNKTSTESAFPSSTDMEMVLSYAFNHSLKQFDTTGKSEEEKEKAIEENLKVVGVTKSRDKYEPYYEENKEWLAPLANYMRERLKTLADISNDATLRKLPNNEVIKSNDWGGSDNTPKTDIITSDGKAKISVKNAEGAQAMSGALDESQATIMNVLMHELQDFNKNKDLANKIKLALQLTIEDGEILEDAVKRVLFSVKDINDISPDSLGWTRSVKKALLSSNNQKEIRKNIHTKLSEIFTSLLNADDDFKRAIVREALLGEIKFGYDPKSKTISKAIPNYMLTWEIGKKKCIIQEVDKYIDDVFKKVKSTINFKGSEDTTYTALRLSLPKKIIDDAVDEITSNVEDELKNKTKVNNDTDKQAAVNKSVEKSPRKSRRKIKS